jgi:isoquinoline 1-oxidoreductase beta subunit
MITMEKIDMEKIATEKISIENVSRRGFLQGMLSASAFVLCVREFPLLAKAARNEAPTSIAASAFHPSIFVGIHTDGMVYIVAHRSEMGNGVRTSLPRILADELDADWSRVTVIQGDGNAAYGSQDTDGSHSVREFFDVLREAGATARLMLVRAAAQQWGIPESQCVADPVHTVADKNSSRKLGYGELATLAAKLPVPKKEELQFKSPQQWRYMASPRPATMSRPSAQASRCLAWTSGSTVCSTRPSLTRRCSGEKLRPSTTRPRSK